MAQDHRSTALDVWGSGPSVFASGAFPQNPYGAVTAQNPTADDPYIGYFPVVRTLNVVPATLGAALLGALAHVVSGTAMTLHAGTGITLSGGIYYSDGVPAANPTTDISKNLARTISITGVGAGAGGDFLVTGVDIYGNTMTQTITVAAGVNTVNSLKAFKGVSSVVPQFTDAQNYSVGLGDVFGLPLYTSLFQDIQVYWATTLISASTGYVAGVATDPNTAALGDVRGTYAVQSASDASKRLIVNQVFKGYTNPLMLGVTPA